VLTAGVFASSARTSGLAVRRTSRCCAWGGAAWRAALQTGVLWLSG